MMTYRSGYQGNLISLGFGKDLNINSILYPESYIRCRPNIRSGFNGNYTRPNAGIKTSSRSVSSERQNSILPELSQSSDMGSGISSNEQVDTDPIPSPLQLIDSTPHSATYQGLSHGSTFRLSQTHIAMPSITWMEKSMSEKHLDHKLLVLLRQLPESRRNTVGMMLLQMSTATVDEQDEYGQGLEFRLRQALELVAPDEISHSDVDQLSYAGDDQKKLINDKFGQARSRYILDPRMTQSCYPPIDRSSSSGLGDKSSDSKQSEKSPQTHDTHTTDQVMTASSNSVFSHSDIDHSLSRNTSDGPQCEQALSVTTILRRLSRCLAVRISHKRRRLASAQQRLSKNSVEEKWLRNKLNDLFTVSDPVLHTQSNYSPAAGDTLDSPDAQVVIRFDRWHQNMSSVVKLLCQLARRLAWIDARMMCTTQTMDQIHGYDFSSLEDLNKQRADLQSRVKEAQDIRSELENCRLRLLDSVPPGLKIEQSTACKASSDDEVMNVGLNTSSPATQSTSGNRITVFLRDRIASHLLNTLNTLIEFHVLDTSIRVDQEVCNQEDL